MVNFFKKRFTMTFYMKSGNIFQIKDLKDYKVTHTDGKVSAFTATYFKPLNRDVFINLEEVEAVLCE